MRLTTLVLACFGLASVAAADPAVDADGDVLPPGAVARLAHPRHRTYFVPFRFRTERTATFTADGKQVVTLLRGRVAFWDTETGKLVRELWVGPDVTFEGRLAPDASTVTVVLRVNGRDVPTKWDLKTGAKLAAPPAADPTAEEWQKLESPDGKYRLSSDERSGGDVVWQVTEVATGKRLWPDPPKDTAPTPVSDIAFTADGRFLVGGWGDRRMAVHAWDATTGKRAFYAESKASPPSVAAGPTGAVVVWGGLEPLTQGQPSVFHTADLATGKRADGADAEAEIGGWLRAGQRLRGNGAGMIEPTLRTALKVPAPVPPAAVRPAFESIEKQRIHDDITPDRKYLVWLGEPAPADRSKYDPRRFPETVSVWDLTTGKLVGRHTEEKNRLAERGAGPGGVPAFEFVRAETRWVRIAPDGGRVVLIARDGGVREWEPRSGKPPAPRFTDPWAVGALATAREAALSPDGTRLATALADGQILIWDVSPSKR